MQLKPTAQVAPEVKSTGSTEICREGSLGLGADLPGGDLIDGDAGGDVGAVGPLRTHPRQIGCLNLGVNTGARLRAESGYHEQPIPERRQPLQRGREVERTLGGRRPARHVGPVTAVHHAETTHRPGRRPAERGEGRHHPVEQGQRERGAEATEHRPPRQALLRDDHGSNLLS